jgi:hypothetical protein
MANWIHKPGTEKGAAWWEGKSSWQVMLGAIFPLYALKHETRPVTIRRIVIGLAVGFLLIYLSTRH